MVFVENSNLFIIFVENENEKGLGDDLDKKKP